MMYQQFAHYYDQLMDLDYEAYLGTWKILTSFQAKDVLEYGCGTGNVTLRLLPQVKTIDAVDASPDMLMLASRKIQSPKCRFFLAENGIFSTQRTYDRIGLFIDVVNYLPPDDFAALLVEFAQHLNSGGEIVFDVSSEQKLAHDLGQQIFRYDLPDGELFWVNEYDEDRRVLDFSVIMYQHQSGDTYTRTEEFHTQYSYSEEDIQRLATGFDIEVIHQSDRSFYRLRKNKA